MNESQRRRRERLLDELARIYADQAVKHALKEAGLDEDDHSPISGNPARSKGKSSAKISTGTSPDGKAVAR
jgi:hypothetical protein